MHRSIDMKSALIGGLVVAVVLCVIGAVPWANHQEFDRFKIETNDSHAFILDSATGQVWSSVFYFSDTGLSVGDDPSFHAIKTYHGQ